MRGDKVEQPTTDQCSAHALLEQDAHAMRYAEWHFQWGGYVGICVVEVNSGGCFDVMVWHDGEFPRNDDPPERYHYCDPAQVIDFGLTVIDKQLDFSRERDSEINEDLIRLRTKINELITKVNRP